jgi:type I restriction enzyme S subunit
MAVPSEQVALKFGDLVQPLMVMISANGEQSQNLINLRDTLLPKLMSGQIRVKEAEKIMEKLT